MKEQQTAEAEISSPPALLAILQAARRVGDRQLERQARRELAKYGIEVKIRRPKQAEVSHAH